MANIEFTSYTKKFMARVEKGLESSGIGIAARVVAQAKSLSPVQEKNGGTLRNSIMWKSNDSEGGFNDSDGEKANAPLQGSIKNGVVYVGSNVFYAPYVELGTRKMAPQPFLRPAIAIISGEAPNIVLQKMKEEAEKGPLTGGERVRF